MNNSVFGKTMENVRKQRDIKLVTTEAKNNYLVSEPNYHITKLFFRKFIYHRKKTQIFINKPECLGLSILEISKIVMHEFLYEYMKPKYGATLCYIDTHSFIAYMKTEDIYIDISNYE